MTLHLLPQYSVCELTKQFSLSRAEFRAWLSCYVEQEVVRPAREWLELFLSFNEGFGSDPDCMTEYPIWATLLATDRSFVDAVEMLEEVDRLVEVRA